MKAGAFFAAAEALPVVSLPDILRGGGLVVVAPHPDDESLGCGGLIAEACGLGIPTRIVVVSDGAGSHPGSRSFPPPRLRALRESETQAAAAALGLASEAVAFIGLPDRFVPSTGPEAEAAGAAIAAAAARVTAGVVCVSWRHDPHCDHLAAANLVEAVRGNLGGAQVLAYPIWGWTLPTDQDVGPKPRGVRIDVSRHLSAKLAAVAAHRSQTTDLVDDSPDGFRLTPEMIELFAKPHEILLETA